MSYCYTYQPPTVISVPNSHYFNTHSNNQSSHCGHQVSPCGHQVSPCEQQVSHCGQQVSHCGQQVSHCGQQVSHCGQQVSHCNNQLSKCNDEIITYNNSCLQNYDLLLTVKRDINYLYEYFFDQNIMLNGDYQFSEYYFDCKINYLYEYFFDIDLKCLTNNNQGGWNPNDNFVALNTLINKVSQLYIYFFNTYTFDR